MEEVGTERYVNMAGCLSVGQFICILPPAAAVWTVIQTGSYYCLQE